MEELLKAEHLTKSFEKGVERKAILDNLSFVMKQGEFVAIMGPSGSGKSTLLYSLSGIDREYEGQVFFLGTDLSKQKEEAMAAIRREQMGFVFQKPTMLKDLNVMDNIIFPFKKGRNKEEIIQRANELMERTGIGELKSRKIHEVSGGQLQRAGICRALMGKPELIFADEPTGALNSKTAEEIMGLFERIHKEGTAILLVTHDPKVAARATRVIFLKDGNIVKELQQNSIATTEEKTKEILHVMEQMNI